ncbi:hypothetical protein ACTXT7_011358 [Hymenolepis weldensis]
MDKEDVFDEKTRLKTIEKQHSSERKKLAAFATSSSACRSSSVFLHPKISEGDLLLGLVLFMMHNSSSRSAKYISMDEWMDDREHLGYKFSYDFGIILFAHNSCTTHLLDKEIYHLADHPESVTIDSSKTSHLTFICRVHDTKNLPT